MSETDGTQAEDVATEDAPTTDAPPDQVPEGIDPETGEVLAAPEPDADDAEAQAENERRAEIAAERQEAEQEEARDAADAEKKLKALDRAASAYVKKVGETLGEGLDGWQMCPMCAPNYPGLRLPVMPDPPTLAAIKVAIGEDPDPTLMGDTYSRPCDKCGGHGKVATGSHVTGHKSVICLDCGGKGYISVGTERDTVAQVQTNGAPPVALAQPLEGDAPRTPEEETLRQLGAIVVWPPKPPDMSRIGGY